MKKDIMEKVKTDGLVFDGALGSQLIARGLAGGESAEAWNLEHPEVIQEIHQAYFEAGADVATANTFGASAYKLEKMGVSYGVAEVNRAGVELAKSVAGSDHYVAGELGPTGEMFQPMGTMTVALATKVYTAQARIIEDAGVDFFIIETMFDLTEALTALKAIRSVSSRPVFCSMTFKKTKKGFFTLVGNSVPQCMQELAEAGASVVGANCSMGSDTMTELAEEIRASVDIPVKVQPNAGLPVTDSAGNVTYPEDESFFVDNIRAIKALGVEIVGGCCGTSPAFIRQIRAAVGGR